jgi:hypothetical protein
MPKFDEADGRNGAGAAGRDLQTPERDCGLVEAHAAALAANRFNPIGKCVTASFLTGPRWVYPMDGRKQFQKLTSLKP